MSVVSNLTDVGRLLLIVGGGIVLLGLILLFAGRIPLLGRLPGDILIRRGGSTFFPIVTSLILSVVLTIILNLALLLFRRH